MESKERYISGKDLFPLIKEQLALGKTVCFTVSGTSMMPLLINNRDQVELIAANKKELKRGDIILFQPFTGKYVLHRITKIRPDGYITTGDGNLHRDGFVSSSSVIGKVVTIHRKGKKINCNAFQWRVIFWFWMQLFPVRKWIFILLHRMSKHHG